MQRNRPSQDEDLQPPERAPNFLTARELQSRQTPKDDKSQAEVPPQEKPRRKGS